jgi:uncharacterized membrane protein
MIAVPPEKPGTAMKEERSMADLAPTVPQRRRRWPTVVLVLSLVLNFLGLGVVAGVFLGQGGAPGGRAPDNAGALPYLSALDAEDRAALRAAWRREGPGLSALRTQRRAETAAMVAALRAEPFDRAALEAALAAQTAALAERQALAQRLLVDRLAGMDAASRAAFADRLEAGMRRRAPPPDARRPD